jgi:hypothetical protein
MSYQRTIQRLVVLQKGLRKPHKYPQAGPALSTAEGVQLRTKLRFVKDACFTHVALVGIHANEVFSTPSASRPSRSIVCSEILKRFPSWFFEFTTGYKGIGTGKVYETSSAWPKNAPAFSAWPPSMAA